MQYSGKAECLSFLEKGVWDDVLLRDVVQEAVVYVKRQAINHRSWWDPGSCRHDVVQNCNECPHCAPESLYVLEKKVNMIVTILECKGPTFLANSKKLQYLVHAKASLQLQAGRPLGCFGARGSSDMPPRQKARRWPLTIWPLLPRNLTTLTENLSHGIIFMDIFETFVWVSSTGYEIESGTTQRFVQHLVYSGTVISME